MRAICWSITGIFGFFLGACTSIQTTPAPETRQALAPSGKLRVGFLVTTPLHATKDPASGELTGPAADLGREMARRLGVPFEPVAYTSFPPVLAGARSGQWDIAMMGITSDREQIVDFTAPYMVVEFSYLVPKDASISTVADIDRPGVRIAVLEKSSPDAYLSRTLRNAVLVRLPTLAEVVQSLRAGRADAVFGTKAGMLSQSEKLPGTRVLEGQFGGEETAIAVPKGRQLGATYAREFIEAAKSDGLVKAAIEKAALRGVVVAPIK
ncbi:MAG: transporter substrate-binding domain-containing protein [Burkholderiales bacterium]